MKRHPPESNSPQPVERGWLDLWREHQGIWLGLILLGLVLWTFLPAVDAEFIGYDDPQYVTENTQVQNGLNWQSIRWAFTASEAANWHPLTWLSHMLDCQLFGLGAWGHHFSSIMLHALNTLLAFMVLRRLTGAAGRSFVVALLFGLHPLRVESVAWVAERKDVLSTFFFLLTLAAYARYTKSARAGKAKQPARNAPSAASPGYLFYVLSFVFFVLGLMSKPMLVTLPFVLLLLDYWPLQRWSSAKVRPLLLEKVPFFVAAGGASIVTFLVQERGGAVSSGLAFDARIANSLVAYCRYIGKVFWPVDLAFFYPPLNPCPASWVLLSGCLLLAASVLAVVFRNRLPFVTVGWFWFVGTLVPVIGLIQVGGQSMADRYSYIPSLGFLLALVWGTHALMARWSYPAWTQAAVVAAAAAGCLVLTRAQVALWKNSETLFRHALQVTSRNYVAHNNLGTTLDKRGHSREAIEQFRQALRDKPDYPEARNNLGAALSRQAEYTEAEAQLLEALKLKPGYAEAHYNLGVTLQAQGRLADAIHQYQQAVHCNPRHVDAHYNLGLVLEQSGRASEAAAEFQAARQLQPNSAEACNNLGVAFERDGKFDEAVRQYQMAIKLKPNYARAHFNLGVVLGRKGQLDAAIAEFQQTLALDPDYAAARTNLVLAQELKRSLDNK